MSNDMIVRDPSAMPFEPNSIDAALHLAKILCDSRLLPRAVNSPEAAFAIIATGRELGLTSMQSLRAIHIIDGKTVLSSDLGLALAKRFAACEWFRLVESTAKVATYETQRKGEPTPTRMSFTIEEAQQAGLLAKDTWRKYPAAMLRARCIMALARAVYPDAMMGVYDRDEIEATFEPEPSRRDPLPRANVDVVESPRPGPSVAKAPPPPAEASAQKDIARALAARMRAAADAGDLGELAAAWEEIQGTAFPDGIAKTLAGHFGKAQAICIANADAPTHDTDGVVEVAQ